MLNFSQSLHLHLYFVHLSSKALASLGEGMVADELEPWSRDCQTERIWRRLLFYFVMSNRLTVADDGQEIIRQGELGENYFYFIIPTLF